MKFVWQCRDSQFEDIDVVVKKYDFVQFVQVVFGSYVFKRLEVGNFFGFVKFFVLFVDQIKFVERRCRVVDVLFGVDSNFGCSYILIG